MGNKKGNIDNLTNMGKGRPQGSKNKATLFKDQWLEAIQELGGKDWLLKQAKENPMEFLKQSSKLLPREIIADVDFREVGVVTLPPKDED